MNATHNSRTIFPALLVALALALAAWPAMAEDEVIWNYDDDGGVYTARSIPDIDGDGTDDVVFAGYYSDYNDVLYCVSGADGSDIWTRDYDDCKGIWGVKPLDVVPDVDGDGHHEVVIGTPGGYEPPGRCVILKSGATGDTFWYWSCYEGGLNAGWIYSVRGTADMNNDGHGEILAACGGDSTTDGIAACIAGGETGGTPLWLFRPDDAVMAIIGVDDITADGIPEAVCVSGGNYDDHTLYCIDGASSGWVTTPLWSIVLEVNGWAMESAGDLDGDGTGDLFVTGFGGSAAGGVYAISVAGGSRLWSRTYPYNLVESTMLPDINGDGRAEVVVGSSSHAVRCLSGADGSEHWSATVGQDVWNVDTIDDIDFDGIPDLVVGALNGKLAAFISGADGATLHETPLYSERIYDVETLSDLDGDGYRDVALCFQDQTDQPQCLIAYTGRPLPPTSGGLLAGPGPAYNNPTRVRRFPPAQNAQPLADFNAYGVGRFGVNVAAGHVTADEVDEILTGPGPGAVFGPHVRGFLPDGTPIPGLSFLAYGTNRFGVNVAAGDIDGDGYDEIITGAGPGAVFGPHVRAFDFDGAPPVTPVPGVSFFAYGTLKYGVNVSAGDIDGDGFDEIVTGAGPGAVFGPHVRGWNVDGGTAAAIPDVSFMAYGTAKYGVHVTAGDLDGDGFAEIITGPGPGAIFGAHVRGWNYDGVALSALPNCSFFAWDPGMAAYGANVSATADLDDDGRDELIVGQGADGMAGTGIKVYDYDGGITVQAFSLEAFDGLTHGARVAGGRY